MGINPAKGLIVGGESAGADLALLVSHLYRDTKLEPPLTGVYAAIPSAVNDETVPAKYKDRFISLKQNSDAPILNRESLKLTQSMSNNKAIGNHLEHSSLTAILLFSFRAI